MLLKNKISLITGGAGAVGRKLCEVFLREGAKVAFTYHQYGNKSFGELEKKGARGYPVEITSAKSVQKTARNIANDFGQVDILVNNVGLTQVLPFALIEEEDWDEVISVNLKGMFLMCKALVPSMIQRQQGVIINFGSLAGHRLLEVPVHYATAKAGVTGFTISLAKELSRYHIRVNSIVPGLLDEGVGTNISKRQLDEYKKYCLTGRPGKTIEVAELTAFIASDKAGYINAQNIFVDGGI
jgi:3-oxoacyl-[acyl-carrier protein] reductase